MSVTNSFSEGGVIKASELNANFNDVVSLSTAIDNSQVKGGITHDKLADNSALSWLHLSVLPFTSGTNFSSPGAFTLGTAPASSSTAGQYRVVPVMRPGWECFLSAIMVTAVDVTTSEAGTIDVLFRLNRDHSSGQIGGGPLSIDSNDSHWIVAKNDPIANPLISMVDGDYIDVSVHRSAGADPAKVARGIDAYFTFKHVLVGG